MTTKNRGALVGIYHAQILVLILLAVLAWGQDTGKPFRVGAMYGSTMTLQAEPYRAVIWGYTNQSSAATITMRMSPGGLVKNATYVPDGFWNIVFGPVNAGGPYTLNFTTSGNPNVVMTNVMFGDVYICSGQSNMAYSVKNCDNTTANEDVALANYTNIRIYESANVDSNVTLIDFSGSLAKWSAAGTSVPELGKFSCLCWQYGRALYDNLLRAGITRPLGLIGEAVGGTPITSWVPTDSLDGCGAIPTGIWIKGGFWNGMIAPFLNVTVRGFLWYQGETEAINKVWQTYGCSLGRMMVIWRDQFSSSMGETDPLAPFLIVQLCSSGLCSSCAPEDTWTFAEVRWLQSNGTGSVPNANQDPKSGIVVSIDVGQRK